MSTSSAQSSSDIVATAEQAIRTLYYDPNVEQKAAANRWLSSVRRQPEAWEAAWQLLQRGKPDEVRHFGTQLLQSKVQQSWTELPDASKAELKDAMITAIIEEGRADDGSRMILTRLCVVLAYFAFQAVPAWQGIIAELFARFLAAGAADQPQLQQSLLLLVKIFAEESLRVSMEPARRAAVDAELGQGQNQVFEFARHVVQSQPQSMLQPAFQTIAAWLELHPALESVLPLAKLAVDAISVPAAQDGAQETLIALASLPSDTSVSAAWDLLRDLLQLRKVFQAARDSGQPDLCSATARPLAVFGESHMERLVRANQALDMSLFKELLDSCLEICSNRAQYPVEETASDCFHQFWYLFQDMIASADMEASEGLFCNYGSYLQQLVMVATQKCRYPIESMTMIEDERDIFKSYREDWAELANYVTLILGSNMIASMGEWLRQAQRTGSWQAIEAVVFCFGYMTESINPEDTAHVPPILDIVLQLPHHPVLTRSCILAVAGLSEWLRYHPQFLTACVPFVLKYLDDQTFGSSAASAMRHIATECDEQLAEANLTPILVREAAARVDRSDTPIRVRCLLVNAACKAIASLSLANATEMSKQLLPTIIASLAKSMMEIGQPSGRLELIHQLNLVKEVSSGLFMEIPEGASSPLFTFVEEAWPHLESLLSNCPNDVEIVAWVCACLNQAIRTLSGHFKPLVTLCCRSTASAVSVNPQPCMYSLVQQIVTMFHDDRDVAGSVIELLRQACQVAFNVFEAALRDRPDLSEAFFQMVAKSIRYASALYISIDGLCPMIMAWAQQAATMPERQVVLHSCSCISNIVDKVRKHPELQSPDMQSMLEQTAMLIARCVSGQMPRSQLSNICDVIVSMNKALGDTFASWLDVALAQPDLKSSTLPSETRVGFVKAVSTARVSKGNVRKDAENFWLVCAGQNVEQAIIID